MWCVWRSCNWPGKPLTVVILQPSLTTQDLCLKSLVWVWGGNGYCAYVWSRLGVYLGVAHVMSEGFVLCVFGVAQTFATRTNRVIHCEGVNLGNLQYDISPSYGYSLNGLEGDPL